MSKGYIGGEDLAEQVAAVKTTMAENEGYMDLTSGWVQLLKKGNDRLGPLNLWPSHCQKTRTFMLP